MTREWGQLVTEGRAACEAIGANKWTLGGLALEVEPMGEPDARNGSRTRLADYAEEIGIEPNTLRVYRQIASSWPPDTRVSGASWTAHRECLARPDVLRDLAAASPDGRVLMRAVRDALGRASARGPEETKFGFSKLADVEKAELVADALDNPDVRQRVIERIKPATRDAMATDAAEKQRFEQELDVLASGGRIPSLEEVNDRYRSPALSAIEGALDDGRAVAGSWSDALAAFDVLLSQARDLPRPMPESDVARRLRALAVAIVDLISVEANR